MDILTMVAGANRDRPAVIDHTPGSEAKITTFAELEDGSNRLANSLRRLGVCPQDKVTTAGYNSPEHFLISNAVRKVAGVGVPMNYRLKAPEMQYQLHHSDSVAVFCGPEHVDVVASILPECPALRIPVAWGTDRVPDGWLRLEDLVAEGDPEPPEIEAGMTGASMTYTAGTTGQPKGAFRRGGTDPSVIQTMIQSFDLQGGDVQLVAGPIYHSAPGAFAGLNTLMGGTNVVMRRFDPEDALRLIETHKVSTTFMAPTLLQRIVNLSEDTKSRYDVSSMRVIIVAAAPCPFETKRRVLELFGPVLYEFYDSSEAGVNTLMRPEEQLEKPGSCGKVSPGCDVKILDEQRNECPVGVPGEIYVRSSAIISEYYKNPEATQDSWRDDYFTVGDVGYFDEDGYLYISDRKRDMIISGGVNIYCAEIENVIHAHPKVWDVAVIGIPDPEWGEKVHAIVQPKPGAEVTGGEIIGWVGEHLADYKKPRSVEFREDFPRDEAGKIRKRDLREPYWQGRGTRV